MKFENLYAARLRAAQRHWRTVIGLRGLGLITFGATVAPDSPSLIVGALLLLASALSRG